MRRIAFLLILSLFTIGIVPASAQEVDALQKFFVYSISADEPTRIEIADFLKEIKGQKVNNENTAKLKSLLGELSDSEAWRAVEVYTTRREENMDGIIDVILYGGKKIPYTEYMPGITKELNTLIIGNATDNRGIDYMYTLLSLYNFMGLFGGDTTVSAHYPGLPGLISLKLSEKMDKASIRKISGAIDLMPTLKGVLVKYPGDDMLDKMLACAEEIINKYDTPEIYHFKLALQELGVAREKASITMTNRLVEGVPFRDLDKCTWAVPQIRELTASGAINGTGKYTYSPDSMITREQFVKIITEAFDVTAEEKELTFGDVSKDAWYYPYVKTAYSAGIITGVSETAFGTGTPVTREQMAAILYRVCQSKGIVLKKDKNVEFADNAEIADFAKKAVEMMASAGIINGMGGGRFAPKNNATRAQAAVMIYNVYTAMMKGR